jgi:hypothetical protein
MNQIIQAQNVYDAACQLGRGLRIEQYSPLMRELLELDYELQKRGE